VVDYRASIVDRLPLGIAVVVVATFGLLFLMTGSLVVPLKAIAMNVLSLSATFGALVWVFQDGHLASWLDITPTGRIDVFTPILMFCVAFGLSMDYEVFLLARIKECYDLSDDNIGSVAEGLGRTGRLVTAAAVLLAVVFVAIATSGVMIVKMFGVGLALAVLVDAFLVRATLVPALMRLAGRANWWAPRPLRRFHLRWGVWETDPVDVRSAPEPAPVPQEARS
jgi:putative drug exporter of the RND superfamily